MLYRVYDNDGYCLVNGASNALGAIEGAGDGWGLDPNEVVAVVPDKFSSPLGSQG